MTDPVRLSEQPLGRLEARFRPDAEARLGDWQPVDLSPVLAGEQLDPEPSILRRSDDLALFYAGKVNSVHGETESVKTWLVMAACREQMSLGKPVIYIDFEDSATTAVERMMALGATAEEIVRLFTYIRPDMPATPEVVDDLPVIGCTLAVVDGVTEAMTLHGLDLKDNADVARFVELLPRQLAKMGAAAVLVDHVTKDRTGRGRFAIGAQHKLAGIDGAAYALEVIKPFGRGMTGLSRLTVTKDRPGFVRPASAFGKGAGDVHLISAEDGSVRVRIDPAQGEGDWQPTRLMDRVSRYLEDNGQQTKSAVETSVKGKAAYIREALAALEAGGFISSTAGPRNSVLYESVQPFREEES